MHPYGSLTPEVLDVISAEQYLRTPLENSGHCLTGEVSYAVTHEGALRLEDVLARRTHVSVQTSDHGSGMARVVGDVMAPLLGWGPERLLEELAFYDESVESW